MTAFAARLSLVLFLFPLGVAPQEVTPFPGGVAPPIVGPTQAGTILNVADFAKTASTVAVYFWGVT